MSKQNSSHRPEPFDPERNLSNPDPNVLREAEGAELSASELGELAKAHGALDFLHRVRLDLGNLPNSLQPNVEAPVSTLGNQETLREKTNGQTPVAIAETFGRFEIIEAIGQGGFARVFRAYDPILDREIALKIPKPEALISAESATRFQREARAAAMLSHPSIVPVFESGEVGPISYIASEYCQGETLASWFRKQNHSVAIRLAVAIVHRLAEAVQHAHQRGVVHRDLKPANILLDSSKSTGSMDERVRITDFGLAKQIDSGEESLTLEGAVVGTPAYMSPEQAKGLTEVEPSTDIYSLGVILFELLSGQVPFKKSTHLETLRAVESEPAPVLSRIDSSIPRDLSAICQKCLSKSPTERYATAHDLASDLNAWLENRPVTARPLSIARRLRQWYSRNTALGSALAFAFASLAVGLAVSLWQWNVANANAQRADDQLTKTIKANQQSENRLHQIEDFAQSLTGLFEDLNLKEIEQSSEPLHEVMAQRLLVVGNQLEQGMIDDLLVEAELKTSLAQSLIALGFASEAVEFAKSAVEIRQQELGDDDLLTAYSITCLGDAYRESGNYAQALEQHQHAKQILSDQLEVDHDKILAVTNQVAVDLQNLGKYGDAIKLFEDVFAKRLTRFEENTPEVLTSMNNLAAGYMSNGQYDLAEPIFQRTLKLREEVLNKNHYDVLTSMDQLARCYLMLKKTADALPLLKETLQRRTETLGPTHQATLISLSGMASFYRATGQTDTALELFEKVVELRKIRLGEHHELTYSAMHDLAATHFSLGQSDKARVLFEQAHEGIKNVLNNDHPKALVIMQNLAVTLFKEGNYEQAIELLKEAAAQTEEKLSLSHPESVDALKKLARALLNRGRYQEAIAPHQKLIEALTDWRGPDDLQTLNATAELGNCYLWKHDYDLAIKCLEPVLNGDKPIADEDYYRRSLRSAYARSGRIEKFQPMADKDLDTYRKTLEPNSDTMRSRLNNLALDCLFAKNYKMAEPLLRETINILETANKDNHRLANARTMLGEALMGLDDLEAAGPLLKSGYEELQEYEKSIHPLAQGDTMIEAAQRLLRYYQEAGELENAEIFEAELHELLTKYRR